MAYDSRSRSAAVLRLQAPMLRARPVVERPSPATSPHRPPQAARSPSPTRSSSSAPHASRAAAAADVPPSCSFPRAASSGRERNRAFLPIVPIVPCTPRIVWLHGTIGSMRSGTIAPQQTRSCLKKARDLCLGKTNRPLGPNRKIYYTSVDRRRFLFERTHQMLTIPLSASTESMHRAR